MLQIICTQCFNYDIIKDKPCTFCSLKIQMDATYENSIFYYCHKIYSKKNNKFLCSWVTVPHLEIGIILISPFGTST